MAEEESQMNNLTLSTYKDIRKAVKSLARAEICCHNCNSWVKEKNSHLVLVAENRLQCWCKKCIKTCKNFMPEQKEKIIKIIKKLTGYGRLMKVYYPLHVSEGDEIFENGIMIFKFKENKGFKTEKELYDCIKKVRL